MRIHLNSTELHAQKVKMMYLVLCLFTMIIIKING